MAMIQALPVGLSHLAISPTTRIRVLLADDHPLGRAGVRYFLEESGLIDIVAEASDGEEALALMARLGPDVALLDLHMPGCSGIEATRRAGEQGIATRVLILTAYDDASYAQAALSAGAYGYLLKSAHPDLIVQATLAAYRGEASFDPALAAGREQAASPAVELSERQIEALRAIMDGLPDKIIARNLGITESTVATHLTKLFKKLGVTSRTQAVVRAMALGLVETMPPSGDPLR